MRLHAVLTTAFAAAAIAFTPEGDLLTLRSADVLYKPYASLISPVLTRRQKASADTDTSTGNLTSDAPLNSDGTLNLTAWSTAVNAACVSALRAIPQSTNPSGNCVCYNLPALDPETGIFEADLRLYKISEPRDGFAGLKPEDVNVTASYSSATGSLREGDTAELGKSLSRRVRRAAVQGDPQLLKVYFLGGQIDKTKLSADISMSDLEALVMPILSLTAKNTTGGTASTNASLNEAAFLTGVFSDKVVMSDFTAAQVAVDAQAAELSNGTVAFVLPGVQIMVFPVGLIITGTWMLLGMVAIGFGTVQRIKYAEVYKRRKTASVSRLNKTI